MQKARKNRYDGSPQQLERAYVVREVSSRLEARPASLNASLPLDSCLREWIILRRVGPELCRTELP